MHGFLAPEFVLSVEEIIDIKVFKLLLCIVFKIAEGGGLVHGDPKMKLPFTCPGYIEQDHICDQVIKAIADPVAGRRGLKGGKMSLDLSLGSEVFFQGIEGVAPGVEVLCL